MGVDITAYKGARKIDCVFDIDGEPIDPQTREPIEDDYVRPWVNPDFPGRADDIESRSVYAYDEGDSMSMGYIGYFQWRNELARIAGYPLGKFREFGADRPSYCAACWNGATGPFSELINFSDSEGTIGGAVAAKLAKDFADFHERAHASDDAGFIRSYDKLRALFDLAAQGGFVRFH